MRRFRRGNRVCVKPRARRTVVSSGMKLKPYATYRVAETKSVVSLKGRHQLVRIEGFRSWFKPDWFDRIKKGGVRWF